MVKTGHQPKPKYVAPYKATHERQIKGCINRTIVNDQKQRKKHMGRRISQIQRTQNKREYGGWPARTRKVSRTEESEVVHPTANCPIKELKKCDNVDKIINCIQVNDIIKKVNTISAEAQKNIKKAEFNSMLDLQILIPKSSVEAKLLQFMICLRNKQKKRAPKKISPVFIEITKRFSLLSAGDKSVIPVQLKEQIVELYVLDSPARERTRPRATYFGDTGRKNVWNTNQVHAQHARIPVWS